MKNRLAPLKVEKLSKSPEILFFHEAVSHQMLERLYKEALPQFEKEIQNLEFEKSIEKIFIKAGKIIFPEGILKNL
jgi:hypothetical protein